MLSPFFYPNTESHMKIDEFRKEAEKAWVTCPLNTMLLSGAFDTKTLLKIAFMIGAGFGLMLCKARGVDEIERQDVRDYLEHESIAKLFEQLAEKRNPSKGFDTHFGS